MIYIVNSRRYCIDCNRELGYYEYCYLFKLTPFGSITIHVCFDCMEKAAGTNIVVWGLGGKHNEYSCSHGKIRYFNDWHFIGTSSDNSTDFYVCEECLTKVIEGTKLLSKIKQKMVKQTKKPKNQDEHIPPRSREQRLVDSL